MKVEIVRDKCGVCEGLMIVPESGFELDFLTGLYRGGESYMAFLKTGADTGDVIGLKIVNGVGRFPAEKPPF